MQTITLTNVLPHVFAARTDLKKRGVATRREV